MNVSLSLKPGSTSSFTTLISICTGNPLHGFIALPTSPVCHQAGLISQRPVAHKPRRGARQPASAMISPVSMATLASYPWYSAEKCGGGWSR